LNNSSEELAVMSRDINHGPASGVHSNQRNRTLDRSPRDGGWPS
jgi:hypothetical protein